MNKCPLKHPYGGLKTQFKYLYFILTVCYIEFTSIQIITPCFLSQHVAKSPNKLTFIVENNEVTRKLKVG